ARMMGMVGVVMVALAAVGAAKADLIYQFDFQPAGGAISSGWTPVTTGTIHSSSQAYGWDSNASLTDRTRYGTSDNMLIDFVMSAPGYSPQGQLRTFMVDVPNGKYTVQLWFFDAQFSHNRNTVTVEGQTPSGWSNFDVPTNTMITHSYTVDVADNRLDIGISASSDNWIINGVQVDSVVPEPATMAFLALGGLTMVGAGLRRRWRGSN
ncbi:MAG: PEP-CTERM sorting domain-containing protein, partial [Phycisphaerae bacterium]|nr:PEP-CTERM sorting domain-containing protein [Phycisphaerae bacterium]